MLIPLGMAEWCVQFWVNLTLTLTSGLFSRFIVSPISPRLQLTFLKSVLCLTNSFGGIRHATVTFLVFSHEASLGMILLKKQTTKLLMILRGCAGWSGPSLIQITEDRFSQSRSNCYMCQMRNLITVKKHFQ